MSRALLTDKVSFILFSLLPQKFAHQGGLNYGFVEFADHATAEQALQAMNGYRVFHHVRYTSPIHVGLLRTTN